MLLVKSVHVLTHPLSNTSSKKCQIVWSCTSTKNEGPVRSSHSSVLCPATASAHVRDIFMSVWNCHAWKNNEKNYRNCNLFLLLYTLWERWGGGLLWWLGKGWDGWSPTEIKCPPPFNLFNLIYTNALSNSKTDMVFAQASIQPALSQRSVWSQWRSTLTDAEVLCSGFIANVYSIVKEKGDPQHWVQARRHHAVTDYNSPLV